MEQEVGLAQVVAEQEEVEHVVAVMVLERNQQLQIVVHVVVLVQRVLRAEDRIRGWVARMNALIAVKTRVTMDIGIVRNVVSHMIV